MHGNANAYHAFLTKKSAEFIEFYATVSRHLKTCFPQLKIGGPAFATTWYVNFRERFWIGSKRIIYPLISIPTIGTARNWRALASPDKRTREFAFEKLNAAIDFINWETMSCSYAFVAVDAYYLNKVNNDNLL